MSSKCESKVVRLRHNQLVGLSEQYKVNPEIEQKDASKDEKVKRSKRPDQVLYRPGMRRQMQKSSDGGTGSPTEGKEDLQDSVQERVESVTEKMAECDIKSRENLHEANKLSRGRGRGRKPDAALYKPRQREEKGDWQPQAEDTRGRRKSEEKHSARKSEENQSIRKGEDKQGVRNSEEKQIVRKSEEKQSVRRGEEKQSVRKTEEKQNVRRSEEKQVVREENSRKGQKSRPRRSQGQAKKEVKPSTDDSFEIPENGLEWDYQVDIDSKRRVEDEFDVDAELGIIGGSILESDSLANSEDPGFNPGQFQGMVVTNSRFEDCPEDNTRSKSRNKRKSKGSPKKSQKENNEKRRSSETKDSQRIASEADKDRNGPSGKAQPHPGGLLHLPAGTNLNKNSSQPVNVPARGRGRSRRGSHRTLYDPNNPNKHLTMQQAAQLSFHDPHDHQGSPDSPYSPQGLQKDMYGYAQPRYPLDYYPQQEYTITGSPLAEGQKHMTYHQEGGHLPDDTYTRDPYYHSGYDQETSSSSPHQSKAQSILLEVGPLENQLSNMVSRRIAGPEGLQKIMSIRKDVQKLYSKIILLDPDLCNHQNVEQLLWKHAFYQIIEVYRQQLDDDCDESEIVKDALMQLIEEGTSFYQTLLNDLQSTYKFTLDDYLDTNRLPPDNPCRKVKLALLSAQRTLICLGDIARYKELANHTTNYGRSRSWYMKAQHIAPKNGRPYNQLAILALYTRRKLDAVYYYIRSLAASNPFLTARESLLSLFEEARKKAETAERKKKEEREEKRKRKRLLQKQDVQHGTEHRLEIWHSADGSTSVDGVSDDEVDDLEKLSMIELNRRFILSYLNVHGKLFTKTGMETFYDARLHMLQEFRLLLSHSPIPVGNTRLLQLMAINMFAVDNTTPKEGSVDEGCRSLLQEQAVQLGLDMFACLINRSIELFREHLQSSSCQIFSEDLHQVIASVKIWSDWMTCHEVLWNPPPAPVDPAFSLNVWESAANLCNVLQEVQISHVKLYPSMREGCEAVILNEDVVMRGFVPLLTLPLMPSFVHSFTEKDIARDCLRVTKLITFGDYLCGIANPVLVYNVKTHHYESCVQNVVEEDVGRGRKVSAEEEDVIVESSSDEVGDSDDGEADNVKQLRRRRQELRKKMKEKDKYEQTIEAALKSNQRPLVIDVSPQSIVPDTNCFIDHLEELKKIMAVSRFTLVVPLIVITELDGLAKNPRNGPSENRDHALLVQTNAKRAVTFLEDSFENRHNGLKAITSKGNFMTSISFRSEEDSDKGNNDDVILSCCLHQIKDLARNFMPDKDQEGPIRLKRDVVLLTDDRNLHLKAHMRNVPVRNVTSFVRWAKIS